MKQIASLIKKDILLLGRQGWFIFLAPAIYIIFFALTQTRALGFLGFMMTSFLMTLMINMGISTQEEKYPNAGALLSATPILRKPQITAQYVLHILLFIYCCIAYTLVISLSGLPGSLSLSDINLSFCISTITFSIFMPVKVQFGLVGIRTLILIVGLLPFVISSILPKGALTNLTGINHPLIFVVTLIILIGSLLLSWRFMELKDI